MPTFKNAIVRKPCRAMINGITTYLEEGKPIYEVALKQHAEYVKTLQALGLEVLELDPLEAYPDSCFVEDTASLPIQPKSPEMVKNMRFWVRFKSTMMRSKSFISKRLALWRAVM